MIHALEFLITPVLTSTMIISAFWIIHTISSEMYDKRNQFEVFFQFSIFFLWVTEYSVHVKTIQCL